ncbi:phosphate ABC transporter ATP-binding protein PstB [Shimazuella sp. AN120528]|uniref:phosphate ABC transporter ATP-binding protein PstB n=1 Tax=Shimazuella soli TaxID=1892854 RepID=UPI001F1143C4|nr:phosphate ABC transporter ATP-binding protein PstB [Shimazuella soli]MCH5584371.1 phosphate ABC transporter ATP-binding protein PstB [Shimazuella soli]
MLVVDQFNVYYGEKHALNNISITFSSKTVTALIGPSGCGKSTLLRSLNRMNDYIPMFRADGSIRLGKTEIYDSKTDVVSLRKRMGMVFQQPIPFPLSIYDNIAYGPRIHGIKQKKQLDAIVEKTLHQAHLWDEVKDRLHASALGLSGGQQQRLVIARVLAVEPEILLLDEPASALDPISTEHIEQLILSLKENYTIIVVTHNMQQAKRISDQTAFFLHGEIVEAKETDILFQSPNDQRTERYLSGQFG